MSEELGAAALRLLNPGRANVRDENITEVRGDTQCTKCGDASAGSRNQGCVLFVFGSQRGDAEFAEVRGDIDFVLCDSLPPPIRHRENKTGIVPRNDTIE